MAINDLLSRNTATIHEVIYRLLWRVMLLDEHQHFLKHKQCGFHQTKDFIFVNSTQRNSMRCTSAPT